MANLLLTQTLGKYLFEVYDDKPDIEKITQVNQTHSNIILNTQQQSVADSEADGLIASSLELNQKTLAIKTADCLPIAYIGASHCALVHAGWRGLHQNIHLNSQLQSINPSEIFIGPCIGKDRFEVTEEFKNHFPDSDAFLDIDDKLYFDLVHHVINELKAAFPQAKITQSGVCTFKNNQYNSYRRNKTTQRNWNILKKKA